MTTTRSLVRALLVILFALIAAIVVLAAVRPWDQPTLVTTEPTTHTPSDAQSPPVPDEPATLEPLTFTIAGAGDMLIHMPVADDAWDGQNWNFAPLMEPVSPYIAGVDLALCHMETPMVPDGQQPSGFPQFGAPRALATSMAAVGWDGCSTASNHAVDQGFTGIVNTLNFLDDAGLGHAGTARTEEESLEAQMYAIEGDGQTVTVAHIAAAHNLNGLPMPEEAPWAVQMINVPALEALAQRARDEGADIVVASIHCCDIEYTTDAEPYQVEVATELAASGLVDVVLSHHAHVPKSIDLLDGGPHGAGMWVAYGLGNFISNQQESEMGQKVSSSGLMAFFSGTKESDGTARIDEAHWLAITVDFPARHTVRPLTAAGLEGAATSPEEWAARTAIMQDIMADSPASELTDVPRTDNTTTVIPRA